MGRVGGFLSNRIDLEGMREGRRRMGLPGAFESPRVAASVVKASEVARVVGEYVAAVVMAKARLRAASDGLAGSSIRSA